jgi:hypothetical protein
VNEEAPLGMTIRPVEELAVIVDSPLEERAMEEPGAEDG